MQNNNKVRMIINKLKNVTVDREFIVKCDEARLDYGLWKKYGFDGSGGGFADHFCLDKERGL